MRLFKDVAIVLAGIVLAGMLIMLFESAGHRLFPLHESVDVTDMAALRAAMESGLVPASAIASVLVAHFLGTLGGSWLTGWLGRRRLLVVILTFVLLVGGLVNTLRIPHPLWFLLLDPFAYLLAGHFGWKLSITGLAGGVKRA